MGTDSFPVARAGLRACPVRAEVTAYDDLVACGSDEKKAKAQGKVRLEGKEYTVKDADIIDFKFNV